MTDGSHKALAWRLRCTWVVTSQGRLGKPPPVVGGVVHLATTLATPSGQGCVRHNLLVALLAKVVGRAMAQLPANHGFPDPAIFGVREVLATRLDRVDTDGSRGSTTLCHGLRLPANTPRTLHLVADPLRGAVVRQPRFGSELEESTFASLSEPTCPVQQRCSGAGRKDIVAPSLRVGSSPGFRYSRRGCSLHP